MTPPSGKRYLSMGTMEYHYMHYLSTEASPAPLDPGFYVPMGIYLYVDFRTSCVEVDVYGAFMDGINGMNPSIGIHGISHLHTPPAKHIAEDQMTIWESIVRTKVGTL